MDILKKPIPTGYQPISTYKCYMDYTYLQAKDKEYTELLYLSINQQHSRLKFEIEKPIPTNDGLSPSPIQGK